jgi:hypothetical protein
MGHLPNLTQSKRRPLLVLAEVSKGDCLLCQITSNQYGDSCALSLNESAFLSGGIKRDSSSDVSSSSLAVRLLFLHLPHEPGGDTRVLGKPVALKFLTR